MTNERFLDGITKNVSRIREYKLGMDGRNGECDCIGLIIGAIRLMGEEWKGTHGSNYAARNETKNLGEIINSSMLSVGDVVYKARKPGQAGYSLPSVYNAHPDKNDYYHVGVVTSTNPLEITHCTSAPGGIKKDKSLGQWAYSGKMKKVEGGDSLLEQNMYTVVGGDLRLRSGPSTDYPVIIMIPDGSAVSASEIAGNDGWMYCKYGAKTGYCMRQYLSASDDATGTEEVVKIPLEKYKELLSLAERMLGLLNGIK